VDGARVHAFGGGLARRGARVALLARAVRRITAEHRRQPLDVLHALWADEPGLVAVTVARRIGVPALVSLMGGELVGFPDLGYGGQLSRVNRTVTRYVLRRASRVTAGSVQLRGRAAAEPVRHDVVRLPLGVDPLRFHPGAGPRDEAPLRRTGAQLLNVASLTPVKDHETLLQALAQVTTRMPEVHLHVVGEGPLHARLASRAAELGVAAHVTFHGAVPHDRLPAYYRAADLCVLSSRHESQGMVILEAAACGRATVGTDVGVLRELAPDHAVPVGRAAPLAHALLGVLARPGSGEALGELALGRVSERYTLERCVAALCSLYDELLDG
jgi:glycosyltransferase involved in cell wall biosynthesis